MILDFRFWIFEALKEVIVNFTTRDGVAGETTAD